MAQDPEPTPDSSWQRAVDRSLDTARARAVSRSAQILEAARSLLEETDGIDFTVQDIVDRSGLSLRSFYKHFAGKDDLMHALLEELLREFAGRLREDVDRFDDPVERLQAYAVGFHRRASSSSAHGSRALGLYHVRMMELRSEEFAHALEPQIELLNEIIVDGVAAGRFRSDLKAREITALLTVTFMSTAQMSLLDVHLVGEPLGAQQLWAWCALAVGIDPRDVPPVPRRRAPARGPAARTNGAAAPARATARKAGAKSADTGP